jgi:hypothetical protein
MSSVGLESNAKANSYIEQPNSVRPPKDEREQVSFFAPSSHGDPKRPAPPVVYSLLGFTPHQKTAALIVCFSNASELPDMVVLWRSLPSLNPDGAEANKPMRKKG